MFKLGSDAVVLVNGSDLSEYLNSFGVASEIEAVESTTFGKNARTYVPGLEDASASSEGLYDGADDAVDEVLAATLRNESIWTYLPQGDGFGNDGYGLLAIRTSYEINTEVADLAKISAEAQSKSGSERTEVLHPLTQETVSDDGTDLDNGIDTANGAVAFLHVTDVSPSETLDVELEHSDDGVAWVPLGSFSQQGVKGAERIEIVGAVESHVRASWVLSGGTATFHVALGRK